MQGEIKLRDVNPGGLYWIKISGSWKICQYFLHDYPDGTSSYFFDLQRFIRIFDFDKIERVIEIDEPADANSVHESV